MNAFPRRAIARELTRIANAPVADVLSELGEAASSGARRIGITGPPGGGKSTLINGLAAHRISEQGDRTIAVLAIDPSSPLSGGSILGDRVRMDAICDLPGLFIRSVPSRGARNGLCDNAIDLLAALERHGFDEIMLETVGIGQSELDVRNLVDTVVLVVPPDAGDSVQAMKAGIIEVADVFVVTKAENPSARRMASEIETVTAAARTRHDWKPPVIMTRADGTGIEEVSRALDRHGAWMPERLDEDAVRERRRRYHLSALISRQVEEVLAKDATIAKGELRSSYNRLLDTLKRS